MFFYLSKILDFLLNPMVWVVALLLWGIFGKKARRASLIGGISVLVLVSNPLLINLILKKWETPPVLKDQLPLTKTAVVLGGVLENNRNPQDQLHFNGSVDRIEEAISLLHEGLAQEIIFSGGSGSILYPDKKEGLILEDFITARGIAGKQITIESNSRNTYENAVETAKILEEKNIKDRPVILITSAFHMPRALLCFKKQGIAVVAFPVDFKSSDLNWSLSWLVPSAGAILSWQMLIKEWIGMLAYKVTGYT